MVTCATIFPFGGFLAWKIGPLTSLLRFPSSRLPSNRFPVNQCPGSGKGAARGYSRRTAFLGWPFSGSSLISFRNTSLTRKLRLRRAGGFVRGARWACVVALAGSFDEDAASLRSAGQPRRRSPHEHLRELISQPPEHPSERVTIGGLRSCCFARNPAFSRTDALTH